MNYRLVKEELTIHHIKKRCDGGKKEISNLALLMPTSHQYLHLIECVDINTYVELNELFKEINTQQKEPTLMQRGVIEDLLLRFEEEHRWDKREGKLLIKRKYMKRW